jgi:carbonic anhydrase
VTDALKDLLAGNQRFRHGESEHDRVQEREQTAAVHAPRVAVLSCADARVGPNLVFDTAVGEVFAVRVAGNLATPVTIASLRYAVQQLAVDTVVVLGHEDCGAVAAALADVRDPGLAALLDPIRDAVAGTTDPAFAVRRNACRQAALVHAALGHQARVVAATYVPATGEVMVQDPALSPAP